jgi:hypothetical protein
MILSFDRAEAKSTGRYNVKQHHFSINSTETTYFLGPLKLSQVEIRFIVVNEKA